MTGLKDIDELYKTTISKLPKEDLLSYCNHRLDNAQTILEKNIEFLNGSQKEQLREMITTIQAEIEKVNRK